MSLQSRLARWFPGAIQLRNDPVPPAQISIVDWARAFQPGSFVNYSGDSYSSFKLGGGSANGQYYSGNSIVFACEANRLLLFSEARFQFQRLQHGREADLFGTPALNLLEEPWPGASTRDLLVQAELDVFQYGNSYWVKDTDGYLLRLNPENVSILTEARGDPVLGYTVGARLLGYAYKVSRDKTVIYEPQMVAHHKPYPDAKNRFVGQSWLSPCLVDVESDSAITQHKVVNLNSGAKLAYAVTMNAGPDGRGPSPEQFDEFVSNWRRAHEGPENSGKTVFLGPGADVKTVGQSFEDLNIKSLQEAGETRIAACAGVPPVIIGFAEGLRAATYANYSLARDRLADGTMRPLWGFFCSAMQSLVPPPDSGSRLWYDDRDIAWLRQDVSTRAEILAKDAATVQVLINAGFIPDAVVAAVAADDLSQLAGRHTGLFSVQLQPPGLEAPPATPPPPIRATLTLPEIQQRLAEGHQVLELTPVT